MTAPDLLATARDFLNYDPVSGVFTWRRFHRGITCGGVAGSRGQRGAIHIRLCGKAYLAHRLAWLMQTGEMPTRDIDHIDGDPSNNAFSNLRHVSHEVNQQNIRKAHVTNKSSGLLGVSLHRASGLWRARITVKMKERCLGYFKTKEEAHAAYLSAKRELHEGCTI